MLPALEAGSLGVQLISISTPRSDETADPGQESLMWSIDQGFVGWRLSLPQAV